MRAGAHPLLSWVFAAVLLAQSLAQGRSSPSTFNVIGCNILNENGDVVQKWPGARCVFLDDGFVISGGAKDLRLLDPSGKPVWRLELGNHHQLNLSNDKRSVLVMSSSVHKVENDDVRFDVLEVRDLRGRLQKAFRFFDQRWELSRFKSYAKEPLFLLNKWMKLHLPKGVVTEANHSNSFYQISDKGAQASGGLFRKDSYIVHDRGLIFVLDPSLQRVDWSLYRPDLNMHDVQVTDRGKILAYVNWSTTDTIRRSFILEIDPQTLAERVLYRPDGPGQFYAEYRGGVQKLENGNVLTSHEVGGATAVEISPQGRIVWKIVSPELNSRTGRPLEFQQVKRHDLSRFFKVTKGPEL